MRSLVTVIVALVAHSAVADPLDTIPGSYVGASWFASPDAPLLAYAHRLPDRPACVDEQLATIDGYFQTVAVPGPSLIVLRGKIDRAKLEACVEELLRKVPIGATLSRDGKLTVLTGKTSSRFFGWADDGSVYVGERAQVDEALAHKTSLTKNKEAMAMIARVDRTRPMWVAGAADYTGKLLGVPSQGFFVAGSLAKPATGALRLDVTIVFASADAARRAAAAIAAAAQNKRWSPGLQAVLGSLTPTVKGTDLTVDLVPLVSKPDVFAEMQAALTAIAKKR